MSLAWMILENFTRISYLEGKARGYRWRDH